MFSKGLCIERARRTSMIFLDYGCNTCCMYLDIIKSTLDKYWLNVELIHVPEYIAWPLSLEQSYEASLSWKDDLFCCQTKWLVVSVRM
jgi:hypothetical protein